MLQDPCSELRRDAVARVIDQCSAAEGERRQSARQAFQRALTGACDKDQVDAIAAALEKLGAKVDLQAHFGVVRSWQVIAPFEHTHQSGWDTAYPPEAGVDLAKTYKGKDGKEAKWVTVRTKDPNGVVDLNKELGKMKGTIAYAYAIIDSPSERLVELRAGSANGMKIFLNGKAIFAREEYHHGNGQDQYAARGTLKAGKNEILLKVCQNEQTENWRRRGDTSCVSATSSARRCLSKKWRKRRSHELSITNEERPYRRPACRAGHDDRRGGVDGLSRSGRQRGFAGEGPAGQMEQDGRAPLEGRSARSGAVQPRDRRRADLPDRLLGLP